MLKSLSSHDSDLTLTFLTLTWPAPDLHPTWTWTWAWQYLITSIGSVFHCLILHRLRRFIVFPTGHQLIGDRGFIFNGTQNTNLTDVNFLLNAPLDISLYSLSWPFELHREQTEASRQSKIVQTLIRDPHDRIPNSWRRVIYKQNFVIWIIENILYEDYS